MRPTPLLSIVYTAAAISLLFSAMFDVHTVSGSSMSPAFEDMQTVFVFRWAYGLQPPIFNRYIIRWAHVQVGDVLVIREPESGARVVKRCAETDGSSVYVLGDNREVSRDSRHYGFVDARQIEGRVLLPP